jgi:hypothetical protein
MDISSLTGYIRTSFMVLRTTGFKEIIQRIEAGGRAAGASGRRESESDKIDGGRPSARLKMTQPESDIEAAKGACCGSGIAADATSLM